MKNGLSIIIASTVAVPNFPKAERLARGGSSVPGGSEAVPVWQNMAMKTRKLYFLDIPGVSLPPHKTSSCHRIPSFPVTLFGRRRNPVKAFEEKISFETISTVYENSNIEGLSVGTDDQALISFLVCRASLYRF